MSVSDYERIKEIHSFPSLIKYLRDDLGWPLDNEDVDDLAFDYKPDELGLDDDAAVKIKNIKQIRPLTDNQPWGIFYINFEPKRLPVVVLRRILRGLVPRKRTSANRADRPAWHCNDLLFISSLGEENKRSISFAHFHDSGEKQAVLRTFSWDEQETHFHWIKEINLEHLRWPDDDSDQDAWREQWSDAFTTTHRYVINTAKDLSHELALLAQRTRKRVNDVYRYENKKGPLHKLYEAFTKVLIHDLSPDDFADMIAQTIAYGLFSARAFEDKIISTDHLKEMIPQTNPFLRELMGTLTELSGRGKHQLDFDELGIADIVEMLNEVQMEAVLHDFGRQTGGGQEDPVIHFYESFLKEYDKDKKIQRGVFYTPKPVVSYIVRSVHEVLKRDFGLEDGLADTSTWKQWLEKQGRKKLPKSFSQKINLDEPFVQILDPATGTGTFLETVIEVISETMKTKWAKEGKKPDEIKTEWNNYVPKHLLPRLNGFELMMAPYAVAHMKLGLVLTETGYEFSGDTRLRVFLTNTLEEPHEFRGDLFAKLVANEVNEASKVKADKPITVIIGNPPYFAESGRGGEWIAKLMRGVESQSGRTTQNYFEVDGESLGERNPKSINDDYVKFIRFSEWLIEKTGVGIHSFITNHGFLDNSTFRGMRQSLITSYSELYLYNLHGNTKKKEICPDGSKDENVFDITQGVSISIFIKKSSDSKKNTIKYKDCYGLRENKYSSLINNDQTTTDWIEIKPQRPFYLLTPLDITRFVEFENGWKLTDISPINSNGIATARDKLTIQDTPQETWKIVTDFVKLDEDKARKKYELRNDTRDWKIKLAQNSLKNSGPTKKNISTILYRPFDIKHTYYIGKSRGFLSMPRPEVMHHMLLKDNFGLIANRQVMDGDIRHFWVANTLIDLHIIQTAHASAYLFPIYLYPQKFGGLFNIQQDWPKGQNGRTPNLSKTFVKEFGAKLALSFVSDGLGNLKKTFGPEDIFNYIYAVFHSPTYRTRYAEFLKIDFPRVPLTSDINLFRSLCALGAELVPIHLMEAKLKHVTTFPVKGDNTVTKVGETGKTLSKVKDGTGRLYINQTQYFDNLPEDVWNFHIGGYQVCHKWLADRKKAGRSLSGEDIKHYHYVVAALKRTIELMEQIDEVIEEHDGWPLIGSQDKP